MATGPPEVPGISATANSARGHLTSRVPSYPNWYPDGTAVDLPHSNSLLMQSPLAILNVSLEQFPIQTVRIQCLEMFLDGMPSAIGDQPSPTEATGDVFIDS